MPCWGASGSFKYTDVFPSALQILIEDAIILGYELRTKVEKIEEQIREENISSIKES